MNKIEIIAPRNFSDFERAEYQRLKAQAKQGWLMFAEAIKSIHGSKLYRLEYDTFEGFCEGELGIARRTAYQYLEAAQVIDNVRHGAQTLPQTERQARPLTKLEPEVQVLAWQQVVEENKPEEITAAKVEQVVNEFKPLNQEVKQAKEAVKSFNPQPTFEQPEIVAPKPLSEKEILQKAKEVKEKRAQEFVQKREEKLTEATQSPIPDYERELIARCEAGATITININKHLHVLKWAKDNGKFQQIDRYSDFGNPFYLESDGDRDFVCDSYRIFLDRKISLHRKALELKGKVLGCHCHPERCHGDEIIQFISDYGHE